MHAHDSDVQTGADSGPPSEPMDATSESLAEALRVSFRILKFVLIIVLVLFGGGIIRFLLRMFSKAKVVEALRRPQKRGRIQDFLEDIRQEMENAEQKQPAEQIAHAPPNGPTVLWRIRSPPR